MSEQPANPTALVGDYEGKTYFLEALKSWWLIPVLALVGGLGGVIFHLFTPQVYEARAQFSISLDVSKTGSMTQYEEDVALNTAGYLISSPAVVERASQEAAARGIALDPTQLRKIGVVERRINLWDLRVRYPDPQKAAELANIWAQFAEAALRQAFLHAVEAQRLDRHILSLESCLSQAAAVQPVQAQCRLRSLPDLQKELSILGNLYAQERQAAQSLHAGLVIGPLKPADLPASPVLYNRGLLVLSGGALGVLVALVVIQMRCMKGKSQRG